MPTPRSTSQPTTQIFKQFFCTRNLQGTTDFAEGVAECVERNAARYSAWQANTSGATFIL